MPVPARPRRGPVAVVLAAALALTACADDGSADKAAPTPTPLPTLSAAQFDAVVDRSVKEIKRADRKFRRCEGRVAGYGFNTCWDETGATYAAAEALVDQLAAYAPTPDQALVVTELERFLATRKKVRRSCRKVDDQKCDQALMGYRTELQDLMWAVD